VRRSSGDDIVAEADVAEQIRICTGLRQDGNENSRAGNPKEHADVIWLERPHQFRRSKHGTRDADLWLAPCTIIDRPNDWH
jgi:hypothetical protein